jgi:hypothetical protein
LTGEAWEKVGKDQSKADAKDNWEGLRDGGRGMLGISLACTRNRSASSG